MHHGVFFNSCPPSLAFRLVFCLLHLHFYFFSLPAFQCFPFFVLLVVWNLFVFCWRYHRLSRPLCVHLQHCVQFFLVCWFPTGVLFSRHITSLLLGCSLSSCIRCLPPCIRTGMWSSDNLHVVHASETTQMNLHLPSSLAAYDGKWSGLLDRIK